MGLCLDAPENAPVLCVDEKPHIQAPERAQGYLRMPCGWALTSCSHEYRRRGTSTLFTAPETASGQVIAGRDERRRRVDLLDRQAIDLLVAVYYPSAHPFEWTEGNGAIAQVNDS